MDLSPLPQNVKMVSGTVKECKLPGCFEPAKTRDELCYRHKHRRIAYTALQLGALIALVASGFCIALWLGLLFLFVSLLIVGVALEGV